jgi:iron complex transport system ATP-binding protein
LHEYNDGDVRFARQQLERLRSNHLADRLFGTLSTGEKQRVLIARSLMTHPKLLLLDEAMTGLDLGARERLVASLADLAADSTSPAAVLVTHHVEEIPPGFSHIVIMSGGRVLSRGPIEMTLTADALSECFGQRLSLERTEERYHAWSRA